MSLFTRLRYALHMLRRDVRSATVRAEYINISPAAQKHFDAAFKQMDTAFSELEKGFAAVKEPSQ